MDSRSVFQLSNGERASCLRNLTHSFGSSYICLWTYSPNLNILYCEDGHFQEEASSSSQVSVVQKLFNEYKQSVFTVENGLVPGLAFRDKNQCLELQELDLQRLASNESQRQFYLEANIKTAVFLGCERGEIELGMTSIPQNLEIKLQNLFPEMEISRSTDKISPTSSQSMDSPDQYSSFFYNFPLSSSSSFHHQEQQPPVTEPPSGMINPSHQEQQGTSNTLSIPITVNPSHHHQQHPLLQNFPFPTLESTDAALTKAYLAILSSPSSSSRGGEQSCLPYGYQVKKKASAFRSYHRKCLGPSSSQNSPDLMRRQTLLKRAIAFYRGINFRRIQEIALHRPSRPSSNQLHHMISERRRREKINESFQALRSLLPQGTKKDKASVLRSTKEYLSSLKAQLSELNKKNQLMETELKSRKIMATTTQHQNVSSTDERLTVKVTPVEESTSTERLVDLQVILRGQASVPDLVIRVLEFLKQTNEANMVSMEAQTHQETVGSHDQIPTNWVTFRLRIEGSEWDESAFIEAVQRLLADWAC